MIMISCYCYVLGFFVFIIKIHRVHNKKDKFDIEQTGAKPRVPC